MELHISHQHLHLSCATAIARRLIKECPWLKLPTDGEKT